MEFEPAPMLTPMWCSNVVFELGHTVRKYRRSVKHPMSLTYFGRVIPRLGRLRSNPQSCRTTGGCRSPRRSVCRFDADGDRRQTCGQVVAAQNGSLGPSQQREQATDTRLVATDVAGRLAPLDHGECCGRRHEKRVRPGASMHLQSRTFQEVCEIMSAESARRMRDNVVTASATCARLVPSNTPPRLAW